MTIANVPTMHTRQLTARARAFGAELRSWRERANLEGQHIARQLSWSAAKVSNIEFGRRGVSEVDAAMYLACCTRPGDDIKQVLAFFHDQWDYLVQPHDTKLADELLSLITLETTASAIYNFELAVIPGLLQTEAYARALISSGLTPEGAVETKVRTRKDRQVLLRREWPPHCDFFIHEHALRMRVGSEAIMNDQLLHLVFASARPHVRIRVVPAQAGPHAGLSGAFTLMKYLKAKQVIYLEHHVASLFLDSSECVTPYREVLTRLASAALSEGQSRAWLAQLASEFDRPLEEHNDHSPVGDVLA
jgi:transcriptional regulator with XRE-family HTH domain